MNEATNQTIDPKTEALLVAEAGRWTEQTVGPARSRAFLAEFDRLLEIEIKSPSDDVNTARVLAVEAPKSRGWNWKRSVGGVFALAAALFVFVTVAGMRSPVGAVEYSQSGTIALGKLRKGAVVTTAKGERTIVTLDDQRISLLLNEGSELRISKKNEVTLERGEVWTVVRPNSGDFEVYTAHGHVEVHGTTFGVKVGDSGLDVVIASGRIEVGVGDNCEYMEPGTSAHVAAGAAMPEFVPIDRDVTPDWALDLHGSASASREALYFPSARPRIGKENGESP